MVRAHPDPPTGGEEVRRGRFLERVGGGVAQALFSKARGRPPGSSGSGFT